MRVPCSISGVMTLLFVFNAMCGEIAIQFKSRSKDLVQVMKGSRSFHQITAADTGITEIGMERTVCRGTCPAVIIRSDATAACQKTRGAYGQDFPMGTQLLAQIHKGF